MDFRVSVVIPTYNRAHFLRESVQSILAQSLPVTEIIIVDDGSTDGTAAVVKSLPGPIRYIIQKNQGPAAARNRGLHEASGDWIAFQDSDDLWVENKNRLQCDFLSQNPHLDFVFGHMGNFGEQGDGSEPEILHQGVNQFLLAHATDLQGFFDQLLLSNPVPTPTVMFRRSCIATVGYFAETLRVAEDFEYWLRFATTCRLGFVNQVLLRRRIHGANLVGDRVRRFEQHLRALRVTQARASALPRQSQRKLNHVIATTQYDLASMLYHQGDFAAAATVFAQLRWTDLPPKLRPFFLFPAKRLLNRIRLGKKPAPRR